MFWILLIMLDVIAVAWLVRVLRDFPRTNKVILDLHNRSHNLSLVERTSLEQKIKSAQASFDASVTFFGVAFVINCLVGLIWLLSRALT